MDGKTKGQKAATEEMRLSPSLFSEEENREKGKDDV
jgi:hypothetical protein